MDFLFRPIPVYPLAFFRIALGLILFIEGIGAIATGWVEHYYLSPSWHFAYIGLECLQPLPGKGMVYVYLLQSLLAVYILLGWHYRKACLAFFLVFGYSFFCEKTHYLNHHYLVWLFCGCMVLFPAAHYCSLDVKFGRKVELKQIPYWPLWLIRLHLVIVYFYAGLAKLQADWVAGAPLRIWFAGKAHYPIIGAWLQTNAAIQFTAWGGLLFDLCVAWALLYKPTRPFAFVAAVLFHVFNAVVFQVGIFPWFMIVATLLFFEPEQIGRWFFRIKSTQTEPVAISYSPFYKKAVLLFLLPYAAFQLLFPFRHLAIKGDVNWTEEGHRFSWRMMLRAKSGSVYFTVVDLQRHKTYTEYPGTVLTADQNQELATHPDMIWQYAQYLKQQYAQKGIANAGVYAHSLVSLNGRPPVPLVDNTTNLAKVPYNYGHKTWVTNQPL